MSDLYPRPSREVIAEMVKAGQPEPDAETGSAAGNFAVHLAARMRALGMTAVDLEEKAGVGRPAVSFALHSGGRDVGLTAAEKIAAAVGGYLATMIGPYLCATCAGEPPKGFRCLECGTERTAA